MKARDLMIGDYVTFKDCQCDSPVIIEIVALGFQDEGEDDCLVNIGHSTACDIIELDDEIVGLPITPEILEKNGFVENRGVTSWKFETKREDLIDIYGYDEYHLSINIEDAHGSGKGYRWMLNNLVIFYVHQLQHALKLCGIEKEIIL